MRLLWVLATIGLIASSPVSAAEAFNVKNLLRACQSEETSDAAWFYCSGVIGGVATTLQLQGEMDKSKGLPASQLSVCFEKGNPPTRSEMAQLFVAWGKQHPEASDNQDALGVIIALKEAYPCG